MRALQVEQACFAGVRNVATETYTKVTRPAKSKTARTVKRAVRKTTVTARARTKNAARRAK